jgi:hypothetical protein
VPLIVPFSDEVLEEARVYRHHYCESVILDAFTPKNRLGRMAKFGNRDKLAYASLTRKYDPMLEVGSLMLIATVSVTVMFISASNYLGITVDETLA